MELVRYVMDSLPMTRSIVDTSIQSIQQQEELFLDAVNKSVALAKLRLAGTSAKRRKICPQLFHEQDKENLCVGGQVFRSEKKAAKATSIRWQPSTVSKTALGLRSSNLLGHQLYSTLPARTSRDSGTRKDKDSRIDVKRSEPDELQVGSSEELQAFRLAQDNSEVLEVRVLGIKRASDEQILSPVPKKVCSVKKVLPEVCVPATQRVTRSRAKQLENVGDGLETCLPIKRSRARKARTKATIFSQEDANQEVLLVEEIKLVSADTELPGSLVGEKLPNVAEAEAVTGSLDCHEEKSKSDECDATLCENGPEFNEHTHMLPIIDEIIHRSAPDSYVANGTANDGANEPVFKSYLEESIEREGFQCKRTPRSFVKVGRTVEENLTEPTTVDTEIPTALPDEDFASVDEAGPVQQHNASVTDADDENRCSLKDDFTHCESDRDFNDFGRAAENANFKEQEIESLNLSCDVIDAGSRDGKNLQNLEGSREEVWEEEEHYEQTPSAVSRKESTRDDSLNAHISGPLDDYKWPIDFIENEAGVDDAPRMGLHLDNTNSHEDESTHSGSGQEYIECNRIAGSVSNQGDDASRNAADSHVVDEIEKDYENVNSKSSHEDESTHFESGPKCIEFNRISRSRSVSHHEEDVSRNAVDSPVVDLRGKDSEIVNSKYFLEDSSEKEVQAFRRSTMSVLEQKSTLDDILNRPISPGCSKLLGLRAFHLETFVRTGSLDSAPRYSRYSRHASLSGINHFQAESLGCIQGEADVFLGNPVSAGRYSDPPSHLKPEDNGIVQALTLLEGSPDEKDVLFDRTPASISKKACLSDNTCTIIERSAENLGPSKDRGGSSSTLDAQHRRFTDSWFDADDPYLTASTCAAEKHLPEELSYYGTENPTSQDVDSHRQMLTRLGSLGKQVTDVCTEGETAAMPLSAVPGPSGPLSVEFLDEQELLDEEESFTCRISVSSAEKLSDRCASFMSEEHPRVCGIVEKSPDNVSGTSLLDQSEEEIQSLQDRGLLCQPPMTGPLDISVKHSGEEGMNLGEASDKEANALDGNKISSKLVGNIRSFIPVIQHPLPNFYPTAKRDVKVKALEAAEAAKRLEEKKALERQERLLKKIHEIVKQPIEKKRTRDDAGKGERDSIEANESYQQKVSFKDQVSCQSKVLTADSLNSRLNIMSPDMRVKRYINVKSKLDVDKAKKVEDMKRKADDMKKEDELAARKLKKDEAEKKRKRQDELLRQRKEQEERLRAELAEKEQRHKALEEAERERKAVEEESKRQRRAERGRERERRQKEEALAKVLKQAEKEAERKRKEEAVLALKQAEKESERKRKEETNTNLVLKTTAKEQEFKVLTVTLKGAMQQSRGFSGEKVWRSQLVTTGSSLSSGQTGRQIVTAEGRLCAATPYPLKLNGTGSSLSSSKLVRVPRFTVEGRPCSVATPNSSLDASNPGAPSPQMMFHSTSVTPRGVHSVRSLYNRQIDFSSTNLDYHLLAQSGGEEQGPQSYEITPDRKFSSNIGGVGGDGEDDDEDEDVEENSDEETPEKPIPVWAWSENLMPQLLKQLAQDPDEIFLGTKTCSLREVFGTVGSKKRRDFGRRSSSGDWVKDRVSWKEELQYKISMGYIGHIH